MHCLQAVPVQTQCLGMLADSAAAVAAHLSMSTTAETLST